MINKGYIDTEIKFPIIVEAPDKTFTFLYGEEPLTKVNRKTANNLRDAIIIDSDAIKYKIVDVINLGYTNRIGGLNIFLERTIYVKITLRKIKNLNLDEFKMLALKIGMENEDYYISAGMNVEDIKEQIQHSTNTVEVMSSLIQ